jgi:hypothetical protein
MSRSRKKIPIVKDYGRNSTSFYKKEASKKVRRYRGIIPDGCFYKKMYSSWDIFDYICYWPESKKAYRK